MIFLLLCTCIAFEGVIKRYMNHLRIRKPKRVHSCDTKLSRLLCGNLFVKIRELYVPPDGRFALQQFPPALAQSFTLM